MIQEVTKNEFVQEMSKAEHGFSYEGAGALYQYLANMEEDCGTQIKFDPIAFRGEYEEYDSLDKLNEDYNDDYDMMSLAENTQVIDVDGEKLIIQKF